MSSEYNVIVTWLYPKSDKFDMGYYLSHHIPATQAAWAPLGLTGCTVCDCKDDNQYDAIVQCYFKDLESWETAVKGPAAKELVADVKNFTSGNPAMVVGKLSN